MSAVSTLPERTRGQGWTLAQFLGMGLVFGASFLFVKIALTGVSFSQISWARIILGGSVLGLICLVGRHRLPGSPSCGCTSP